MNLHYDIMWTEKYRPKSLKTIIGHKDIVSRLNGFVEKNNLPHLLFAGPPGTGKTTAVLALANDLFKKTNVSRNLLELNASDERGIDIVRTKIKEFARTMPYGNAPFKIICLDEADSLTSAAQHALRRTMEQYVRTSRFALICNYSSKIIEPVQSRCATFRFGPLETKAVRGFIEDICEREDVPFTKGGIDTILYISEGDLRKSINILQATAASGNSIEHENVLKTVGHADPEKIKFMLKTALDGHFEESRKYLNELTLEYGLSANDVIKQIYRELSSLPISSQKILIILEYLAEVDFRIAEGASGNIQIGAFLARLSREGV